MTMNLKLKNTNSLIASIKGQHMSGKRLIDVEGLLVVRSNNKYLSSSIFKKIPKLKVLSVMYFSVEKIVEGNFNGAQYLKYVYINNNDISELGNNIFRGASKLFRIEMKSNSISSVSSKTFAGLTTLEHINLDHNNLKTLPKDIFTDLINLKYVSLFGNILESVDGNLFKNNLKITNIWFSNNHLSVIGPNLLKSLKHLIDVYFFNNPCIHTSLYKLDDVSVLNDKIANCTESNKPEQKFIIAESEKYQTMKTNNLLNEVNTELKKSIEEQNIKNRALTQNVKVLQNNINAIIANNTELGNTITEKLQQIETLNQDVEMLHQNISKEEKKTVKCQETNKQKLAILNQDLKTCQVKTREIKFAFNCFH